MLAALERPEAAGQRLDLGGPEAITLRRYLGLWRRWLGMGEARFIAVPRALARLGARPGEAFGRGPLGMTMWRMLERDSVVSDASLSHSRAVLEWNPAPMETALARGAASSADRWQARTVFLRPLLHAALALTFLASGAVGLMTPVAAVESLFEAGGMP